jgi:hypothetical protein
MGRRSLRAVSRWSDTPARANGGCFRLSLLAQWRSTGYSGTFFCPPSDAAFHQRGSLSSPLANVLFPSRYRYEVASTLTNAPICVKVRDHLSRLPLLYLPGCAPRRGVP